MVRILHVFGCLDRGGAETAMMNFYRGIDRSKVQFDFVTHFDTVGAYEDEILKLGGKIYRLPRFSGVNILSYSKAWRELLCEHREWSVIHVHIFTIAGVILPIAKRCGITTRIVHSHNTGNPITTLPQKFANVLFKQLANIYSTHKFACSTDAGEYFFNKREFKVLLNAISVKNFIFSEANRAKVRKALGLEDKFVIGHIGSFTTQKNHKFIIAIFKEIQKLDPQTRLMLVGIGDPCETEIEAADMGLKESTMFLGERDDVPELMQAMDIFMFPSLWEGLGIAAIESQAAGLPTVISDKVPDATMITPLAKKLELSAGAEHWAKEILRYKENQQPRGNLYEEIKSAGYDIDDNVKWLETFYLNEAKG